MEIKRYGLILWRWRALLVVATLIAGAFGYWRDRQLPPVYRATTTLVVGQFLSSASPGPSDLAISEQLAQSYVQLVRHEPVLRATIDRLGLQIPIDVLAERVAATHLVGTPLLDVIVTDPDPREARGIADELAAQLIAQAPAPLGADQEHYRQFATQEVVALQARIQETEHQVADLENQAALDATGPDAQAQQARIDALQARLTGWRNNYASLLDFVRNPNPPNSVRVLQAAALPTQPVAPLPLLDLGVAAATGFILACLGVFLIEYLDDTLSTAEDVTRVLNQRTLASIGRLPKRAHPADLLVTRQEPQSPFVEAYRVLRTNLQFSTLTAPGSSVRRLAVTSAVSYEGKSLTACNLAITMAQAGKRVILCDADLRRPTVHRIFASTNRTGLTTLLLEDSLSLEAAVLDTPVDGLRILPSGPLPPNPAELLGSAVMERRLSQLDAAADIIICDAPAVLELSDTQVLASRCDAVLLVVRAGSTRTDLVKRSASTLQQVGANILGVVINGVAQAGGRYESYTSSASPVAGRWRRLSAGLINVLGFQQ